MMPCYDEMAWYLGPFEEHPFTDRIKYVFINFQASGRILHAIGEEESSAEDFQLGCP
jgi:hypothetical protein